MEAKQRMRWTAGLATAIAIAGVGSAGAQQAGSTGATAGAVGPTSAAPGVRSGFADIRTPQSLGFNPGAISPFSPNFRGSFSGGFNSFSGAFGPFGFNPVGSLVGGVPTFANSRAPQSGFFNPAANVPFNGAFVDGFSGVGGGPFFVAPGNYIYGAGTPAGAYYDYGAGYPAGSYYDPSIGAVVVPVAVPVPVTVPLPVERRRLRMREAARPTSAAEQRSLQVARELMTRAPLTEGFVVSADRQKVRVRVGSRVRSYPRSQVFFFTKNGEMRSSSLQEGTLARGSRVLVPAPNGG